MKKKALLAAAALAALMVPQVAGAEGFGIVEWSAQGTAMGGARMFAENDAAMVAYNPASIVKVENGAVAIHATQISPHGKSDSYTVNPYTGALISQSGHNKVNPGRVPGLFFAKKINTKDWVGFGTFTRYGMVSEFEKGSLPALSAKSSKMIGLSMTPVYAHKFDKKWSAAAGAELNYVGLTLERDLPMGMGDFKVKGETWALGWNAAANYSFDDKNEIGVVYRSKISQNMRNADLRMGLPGFKAGAKVVLPDQWSIGYNHKFNNKTRVELNALRTNWKTYESLNMHTNHPAYPSLNSPKNWKSGWRYAIGLEHKLSEKYAILAGYSYDKAVIPKETADFMIPTGNRRTYTVGVEYNDKKQTLAATLGYMKIGDKDIVLGKGGGYVGAHTHDNNAPIISIGYQYKF